MFARTVLAKHAQTRWEKMRGLIGKPPNSTALFIPNCNFIHTFGMRMPIDVVFLNGEYRVVDVVRNVQPWRIGPRCKEAEHVLEIPSHTGDSYSAYKGKILTIMRSLV